MRVSVNVLRGNAHAVKLCRAFAAGVAALGDRAVLRSDRQWDMKGYDLAVFWGYVENCQKVEAACREKGIPFVYFDLAYWVRDKYYKVTVNSRHPDDYLMQRPMPDDRWKSLGLTIAPWQVPDPTKHILLAGMSGKAAWSWGMTDEQWEHDAIARLREVTQRQIIYRPKPSWPGAKPISGTAFSKDQKGESSLNDVLANAHCVVTHHSNVGVDALLAGVPVFTRRGAALHLGLKDDDLSRVNSPIYPEGREQWAANLAYCQWTLQEMRRGPCWKHIRSVVRLLK